MNDLNPDDQPEKHENPQLPSDTESDFPLNSDSLDDAGTPQAAIDPLAELRKKIFEEEAQPQQQPKPDLLQRMTSSSKKVPTRPRTQTLPDQGFVVRTSRSATSETPSQSLPASSQAPSQPRSENNDEIRDDFLQRRLGTDSSAPQWNRPNLDRENGAVGLEQTRYDAELPSAEESQSPVVEEEPKIRPRVGRRLDPLWDGADPEEEDQIDSQRPPKVDLLNRPVDDRRLLGSGGERQYEVNRYLSYNPRQSLWGKFLGLSGVEQGLVVALIIAIIAVGGLIAYLYYNSRHPVAVQIPTSSPVIRATELALVITEVATRTTPVPIELQLPGGWDFPLKASKPGSQWQPTSSEWLSDTEIRRVVGLPWNKQIESVIQTFAPEDLITLVMNNGDKLVYKVTTVSQVDVQDTSVLRDTRPSLAIVLFNATESNKRWVVIAFP